MLPAARSLPSGLGGGKLRGDLRGLLAEIGSVDFDLGRLDRLRPLMKAALFGAPDAEIWEQAYRAVAELELSTDATPERTPWRCHSSSFAYSTEFLAGVCRVLTREVGPVYVGVPLFDEAYFGRVAGLDAAADAVFARCAQGPDPLFAAGWAGWPADADPVAVQAWLSDLCGKPAAPTEGSGLTPAARTVAQPHDPFPGPSRKRGQDACIVETAAAVFGPCSRSRTLVCGVLNADPDARGCRTWLGLATYARSVLATQIRRRFVLGFSLCGPLMRTWAFDRMGAVASEEFDVNEDGRRLVAALLAFLCLDEAQLGLDPTVVIAADGQEAVEIHLGGRMERLVVDEVLVRRRCVAGRATTCWRVHLDGDPRTQLVVKDSWQGADRVWEEGELLKEAAEKGVVNVARYYHHETVLVGGRADEIQDGVRGGWTSMRREITGSAGRG